MKLQILAREALSFFQTSKRIDGNEFVHTENAPEWVVAMCRDAHGDMLPDDWKYQFIFESLNAIADADDQALEDNDVRLEADIYTHDLLGWVSSNLERPSYCDQFVEEYGTRADTMIEQLMNGQYLEKNEVLQSVLASLEIRLAEVSGEEN